jgi:hypothetical protein
MKRQAVPSAVAEPRAQRFVPENDHVVPGLAEQICGREAGRAGADYERLSARALSVHSCTDGVVVTFIRYLPALALRDA